MTPKPQASVSCIICLTSVPRQPPKSQETFVYVFSVFLQMLLLSVHMASTLRVLPRSCCACAGVYPSSMARSIIHRLVRPGILLFIINLEWNKASSADSPEDFIISIKTFGLMWTSWISAFRVPIPLVSGTSLTVHGHYTQGYCRDY